MLNTPILFIIFNRPETTRQVFENIRQAQPKQLFVENKLWKFLNKLFSIDIQIPSLTGIFGYICPRAGVIKNMTVIMDNTEQNGQLVG